MGILQSALQYITVHLEMPHKRSNNLSKKHFKKCLHKFTENVNLDTQPGAREKKEVFHDFPTFLCVVYKTFQDHFYPFSIPSRTF